MFLRVITYCIRRQLIVLSVIFSSVLCCGCSFIGAELNNRGGYLDKKGDEIWFVADTKPMRVLRAYVLLGSITRLAQTNYKSERELIVKHVNTSALVAAEAFYCAYSQPGTCVYFDERMVELEISVLRLLVSVLSKKEEEELFQAVSKQLSNVFPVLKTFDSLSALVDGLTSTGELALNASRAIASLLKVGQVFYIQGRRIGALYRDAIELQMVTIVSSLDTICAIKRGQFRTGGAPYFKGQNFETALNNADVQWAVENFYGAPEELPDTCESYRIGVKLWQRGAGDLKEWVAYLNNDAIKYRSFVLPNRNSFVQASDLLWRACEHLTSDAGELSDCIGRRPTPVGSTPISCVEDFNNLSIDLLKQKSKEEDVKKQNEQRVKVRLERSQRCGMIMYLDTMELRVRQRAVGGSAARLEWLSGLTPSPSNVPSKHPAFAAGQL